MNKNTNKNIKTKKHFSPAAGQQQLQGC